MTKKTALFLPSFNALNAPLVLIFCALPRTEKQKISIRWFMWDCLMAFVPAKKQNVLSLIVFHSIQMRSSKDAQIF